MCLAWEEDGGEREDCLKPKAPPKLGYKISFKRRGLHRQELAVPGCVRGGLPGSVAAWRSAAEGGKEPCSRFPQLGPIAVGGPAFRQECRQGRVTGDGSGSHWALPASQVSLACLCVSCPPSSRFLENRFGDG